VTGEAGTPAARRWVDGYADGACSGNPGPGGWAYRIEWPGGVEEGSGGAARTTNNRMELTAVGEALGAFAASRAPGDGLRLHVDSLNVIGWLARGWKRRANLDLFPPLDRRLDALDGTVQFVHVRGHGSCAGNNRVDGLAVAAARVARERGAG